MTKDGADIKFSSVALTRHLKLLGNRQDYCLVGGKYEWNDKKSKYQIPKGKAFTEWVEHEAVVNFIRDKNSRGENVWISLNSKEKGNDSNRGVNCIYVLWFDIDAPRTDKTRIATKKEREIAFEKCEELRGWICDKFAAIGFKACSGNGCHLFYPIEPYELMGETIREQFNEKQRTFLKGISKESGVEIDTTTDIRRVTQPIGCPNVKIPGKPVNSYWVNKPTDEEIEKAKKANFVLLDAILNTKIEQSKPVIIASVHPEFEVLLKNNAKLKDLYAGNWQRYGFPTRSEAEESLVTILCMNDFSDEEIKTTMEGCKIGKWREKSKSYQDKTIKKGREFAAEHKEKRVAKIHKYEQKAAEEKEKFKHKAYFEKDCKLYLEILTTDEQYKFGYLNDSGGVELIDYVDDTLPVELPITKEGELAFIVKLPSEDIAKCESLEPDELIDRIQRYIRKYCDMPDMDIELCSYYALFTWFYKKCNTTGYLRFLADSGKGKSRMLTVVSDICLYPTSTGGSSSFSGMMRTNERWHGTLVIDEADISGDKGNQVIKYLNHGFEDGKYFMLSDKNDPKQQEVFNPFSPKIIGMREHFRDNATEGRLLSISPHETTDANIPIILDKAYYKESAVIRNYIARFVLEYWPTVDGGKMLSFGGLGIEPRLQQLAMPLSIIFQLWARGSETFKHYMMSRQKELKKDRAQSWEGNMFNLVYAIAKGNERVKDFEGYYDLNGEIQAIAPTMMAKTMNTSATTVTRTLRSVGFEGELRHITEYVQVEANETEERRKRVRTYVVPDERTWREMIQRYYYEDFDEEVSDGTDGTDGTPYRTHKQRNNNGTDGTDILTDNEIIEIPNVLKSKKFDRVPCTVPSVPSVPQNGDDRVNGTDGTQYSKHKEKTNTCEEDNPTAKNQGELSGDGKGIGAEGTEKQQPPLISPKAFDDDFQAQQALEAKERLEAEGLEIDQGSSNEEQSEDRNQ